MDEESTSTLYPRYTLPATMFKLVVLPLLFAAVSAGYLGAPALYAAHAPIATYAAAAPIVAHAPFAVAHAPVATSYANTYRTVNKPLLAAYAAPAVTTYAAAAPLAVAHHPIAYTAPFAHAFYHK